MQKTPEEGDAPAGKGNLGGAPKESTAYGNFGKEEKEMGAGAVGVGRQF